MCLAIPMRVSEMRGNKALVEQEGVVKEIRIDLLPDIQTGDYVLAHAGIAIQRVDPEEAEETLRLIRMLDEIR